MMTFRIVVALLAEDGRNKIVLDATVGPNGTVKFTARNDHAARALAAVAAAGMVPDGVAIGTGGEVKS